jgi:hypothetical protein
MTALRLSKTHSDCGESKQDEDLLLMKIGELEESNKVGLYWVYEVTKIQKFRSLPS